MSERYCPNCGEYHDIDLISTCPGAKLLRDYDQALKRIKELEKEVRRLRREAYGKVGDYITHMEKLEKEKR
jgi:hypothetical protein